MSNIPITLMLASSTLFYLLWVAPLKSPQKSFASGIFAFISHAALTFYSVLGTQGWNLNVINSLLFVLLLSVLVVLIYKIHSRFVKLPLVAFVFLAFLVILLNPEINAQSKKYSWQMDLHITLSMFAYALLSVAALYAVSLWFNIRNLKNKHFNLDNNGLSIMDEEKKLTQIVILGWLTLTSSLLSGVIFVSDFLETSLGHKITFSLLAWLVFGAIILGRLTKGWRGDKLISLVIIGMMFLAIGYLGSKIVLELIL